MTLSSRECEENRSKEAWRLPSLMFKNQFHTTASHTHIVLLGPETKFHRFFLFHITEYLKIEINKSVVIDCLHKHMYLLIISVR